VLEEFLQSAEAISIQQLGCPFVSFLCADGHDDPATRAGIVESVELWRRRLLRACGWRRGQRAAQLPDAGVRAGGGVSTVGRRNVDRVRSRCLSAPMEPVRFTARIRFWNPAKASGLAVCDIPSEQVAALGGLKQQRVRGRIRDAEFTSSVMPSGGGRLALSVSKAMMKAADVRVGDQTDFEIETVGRE
jgi:hypothetical protein